MGVLGGTVSTSMAQFITIAPGGPSGYSGETVYGAPYGPPPAGPGATPILFPPPPPNPFAPPGTYIVDALSSGMEAGNIYLYSVSAGAVGAPGSPVAFEAAVGTAPSQFFPGPPAVGPLPPEPEGDVFVTGPLPIFGIPGLAGPVLPGPIGPAGADEFALGLNVGDDLNALMMRMPAMGVGTAYYSLGLGGTGLGPFAPADIITPAGAWALAVALGLDTLGAFTDDIDALLIQDLGIPGVYDPADFVAFSLTPASATLGLIGALPGDLLMPVAGGPPVVFITGAALGLAPMDNLDALDVVVPEPASWMLVTTGCAALAALRARRKGKV